MWLLFISLYFQSLSIDDVIFITLNHSSSPHITSVSLPCHCMFSVSLPFFFLSYLDSAQTP